MWRQKTSLWLLYRNSGGVEGGPTYVKDLDYDEPGKII